MSTAPLPSPSADVAYQDLHLVLITGMSGAGKSVALKALEDSGYYCVDNLPAELISQLLYTLHQQKRKRTHIAIAVDGRTFESLHLLPTLYHELNRLGADVKLLFLNASNTSLIRRFSETRRKHPLSDLLGVKEQDQQLILKEAIQYERQLLSDLYELGGAIIDSSLLRPAQLQSWVKDIIKAPKNTLSLVFESFAFKRGIPVDADYVFDVRILPNPHYEPELKSKTGKDIEVKEWLETHEDVLKMKAQIAAFLNEWLPAFVKDHRSYLTVAIGCTGGQHRSVYFVETLAKELSEQWKIIVRHREQD